MAPSAAVGDRQVGDEDRDHGTEHQRDRAGTEAERADAPRLAGPVREGGAQRTGGNVGEPEGGDRGVFGIRMRCSAVFDATGASPTRRLPIRRSCASSPRQVGGLR